MRKFKNHSDEDLEEGQPCNQLGFFTKARKSFQHDVYIDEPFMDSSYYRNVLQMLYEASEGDIVVFHCVSPGGLMSGLQSLVEALKATDAFTIGVIEGECASAASMFVLYCDDVFVTESASFLCHNVRYGAAGKGNDVLSQTAHIAKTTEKFLRDTYRGFLSEVEISDLLQGKEIYFDNVEIQEHLDSRKKFLETQDELAQLALEEASKPVKPPAKKTTPKKKAP